MSGCSCPCFWDQNGLNNMHSILSGNELRPKLNDGGGIEGKSKKNLNFKNF